MKITHRQTFHIGKPTEPSLPHKQHTVVVPTKPKTVLLPGSPPEIAYAPPQPQQQFYEAHTSMPFTNAMGTETKKTVRMDESTENARRIVTVEQTSRIIKFGDTNATPAVQKQQTAKYYVPKPKKFVQGQFRESDYESDVDSSKIRPKWAPADSDTEELYYRRVQAPTGKSPRSLSAPVRQTHVASPMEFDTGPPTTSLTQIRREDTDKKISFQKYQQHRTSGKIDVLQPGAPPEYGFISRSDVKRTAGHIASRHMSDMTSTFKTKTEKFVSDIQSDLRQGKPILKHPNDSKIIDSDEPRTYREESRLSEHGTKQIDPDTGLIYFKYDFGYEFGIVLPGEGKRTVESSKKSIQGQRRSSDIEVPIIHEFTEKKTNGFVKKGQKIGNKFGSSKTVKWEPTSESEFSEAEDTKNLNKKQSNKGDIEMAPPTLVIPSSVSPSRWDHTTPSPLSLSPSLPSLSPRQSSATGPPSNVDSAEDAGTYACTATNSLGSTVTSANLEVPGNRRSIYAPIS